jgi:hypothetical protein
MSPRDLVYVGHMLDMARKAVAKVQDLPRETYDADTRTFASPSFILSRSSGRPPARYLASSP